MALTPHWARIVRESPSAYEASVFAGPAVACSRDVAALLTDRLGRETNEVFVVVCIDALHHILCMTEIGRGATSGLSVAARDVFRVAVIYGASAVILAHNHPSGDPKPSPEDVDTTRALVAAGKVLGVDVADHIVFAGTRYWSMRDRGEL